VNLQPFFADFTPKEFIIGVTVTLVVYVLIPAALLFLFAYALIKRKKGDGEDSNYHPMLYVCLAGVCLAILIFWFSHLRKPN